MKRLTHCHNPSTAAGRTQSTIRNTFKVCRIKILHGTKVSNYVSRLIAFSKIFMPSVSHISNAIICRQSQATWLTRQDQPKRHFPKCAVTSCDTCTLVAKARQLAVPHHSCGYQNSSVCSFWYNLHSQWHAFLSFTLRKIQRKRHREPQI